MARDRATIASLKEQYEAKERCLVLKRLEERNWAPGKVAKDLEVWPRLLQRLIDKHGLRELYEERSPGRGRPRSR